MPSYLRYQDARGKWQKLFAPSLLKREALRQNFEEISEYVKNVDQAESFQSLYDKDEYFSNIINETLTLGGIDPDRVSLDQAITFLLPHQDAEGKLHRQGVLIELAFPETTPKPGSKPVSHAELLAMIWGAVESLEEALKVADNMPHDLLMDIMEARAAAIQDAMISPEEKYKKEMQKKAKEDIQTNGLAMLPEGELEEVEL